MARRGFQGISGDFRLSALSRWSYLPVVYTELFCILTQKLGKSSENGFFAAVLAGWCIHTDARVHVSLVTQKESLRVSKFGIWALLRHSIKLKGSLCGF